jgi:hypothetical protein
VSQNALGEEVYDGVRDEYKHGYASQRYTDPAEQTFHHCLASLSSLKVVFAPPRVFPPGKERLRRAAAVSKWLKGARMMCTALPLHPVFGELHVNPLHKEAFQREMTSARHLIRERRLDEAFACLERVHVLGQEYVSSHVLSHWHMFRVERRRHEPKAALGQVMRIVLGALGSAVGSVPTGNTGGTDISMFKRMPIDPKLMSIMQGREPDALVKGDSTDRAGAGGT